MVEAVFSMETIGTYPTVEIATGVLMRRVKDEVAAGGMSWQILETACWVKDDANALPLMFPDARDLAIDAGWMCGDGNGEWLGAFTIVCCVGIVAIGGRIDLKEGWWKT